MNKITSFDLTSPADEGASATGGQGPRFDLLSLWSAVYRNLYLILGITAGAVIVGLILTLLSSPIYRAESRVQVEQQTQRVLTGGDDVEPATAGQDADRFLQTQTDLIQSRSLAERVANSLGLFRGTAFLDAMQVTPATEAEGAFSLPETRREQVLDVLQKNLSIDLPVNSRIVAIRFESPDRVMASRVANSFADNTVVTNLERKYDASSYARKFLETQLVRTRQRLEESERSALQYARGNGLIDTGSGGTGEERAGSRSLTTSSLVQLNTSLSEATAARIAAEQRWRRAEATSPLNIPEVLNNPTIQQLQQQRAQLRGEYQLQDQVQRPGHPEMQQLAARIAEIERQIGQQATAIRASIREQYEVAANQESQLRGNIGVLKSETQSEQGRAVGFNILQREVDTNRALYDGLLQRYKEISAASGLATNNITIVDRSRPPVDPVSPKPLLNLLAALLGGLALALGIVLLKEHLYDRILSADDVGEKLRLPFLGAVPVLPSGTSPREALADSRSPLAEGYHAMRTALQFSAPGGVPSSLMFTSTQPGEGKSTSSVAIAHDFARIGKRVLLIDGDLRKPSLDKVLDVQNNAGFSSLLTRQRSFADVVQRGIEPNLDFVSSGPIPPNPAEILAGPAFAELLAEWKQHYDLVVVDAPPVLGLADAPLLASQVAGTVFVVQTNRGNTRQTRVALSRLRRVNVPIVGAVLTRYDPRKTGYGASYNFSYEYGAKG